MTYTTFIFLKHDGLLPKGVLNTNEHYEWQQQY